jgi:hypothetical protein
LVPIEDTAETLLEIRREGKILAIGVSNYSPEQMDTWRNVAPLHSAQPPYNISLSPDHMNTSSKSRSGAGGAPNPAVSVPPSAARLLREDSDELGMIDTG